MATKNNRLIPSKAVHPGEILREELRERGITQKDFARAIGVQATHLNEFIKGKRNLNEELAMKLESQSGIPFKVWMNLHNGYMYESKALAEKSADEQAAHAFEKECAEKYNLPMLYKRLGLSTLSCNERVGRIKELCPFDLLSADRLTSQVPGLVKHDEKDPIYDKDVLTWLVIDMIEIARLQPIGGYGKGNALAAARHIARMTNGRILTKESIKECLNRYGIAYINVEKLGRAPINACSTFAGDMPVITVSYRDNDMDTLAFDILRELCHIDRHFSEDAQIFISIEAREYPGDIMGKEASEFARQMLIPDETWEAILRVGSPSLSPYRIVKTIATEAERCGISKSIAISRYKHEANSYRTSAYRSPKIS